MHNFLPSAGELGAERARDLRAARLRDELIRSPAGKQAAALLEEWLAAGRDQFLAHGADSAWGRAYLEGARPAVLLVREIHPAIQDLAETAGVGGPGASGLTEITAVLGSIGFDGDDGGGDG